MGKSLEIQDFITEMEITIPPQSETDISCWLIFISLNDGTELSCLNEKQRMIIDRTTFQFIPELRWVQRDHDDRDEGWLPFKDYPELRCDVHAMKEGQKAHISIKNMSGTEVKFNMNVLMIQPTGNDDSTARIRLFPRKSEIKRTSKENMKVNLSDFFIGKRNLFRDGSITVVHPKTMLTLDKLHDCISERSETIKSMTYLGPDSGENMLATINYMRKHHDSELNFGVLWTKWDRGDSTTIKKQLVDIQKQDWNIEFILDSEFPFNKFQKRSDMIIVTYCAGWAYHSESNDFQDKFEEYKKFLMKHDTRLISVDPTPTAGLKAIARSSDSLNCRDASLLYPLVRLQKAPLKTRYAGGSCSTSSTSTWTLEHFDEKLSWLDAKLQTTEVPSLTQEVYGIDLFSDWGDFAQSNLFDRLHRTLEYTSHVIRINARKIVQEQYPAERCSRPKIELNEIKDKLKLPELERHVKDHFDKHFFQRFPFDDAPKTGLRAFLSESDRWPILLLVEEAEWFTKEIQTYMNTRNDLFQKTHILFLKSSWGENSNSVGASSQFQSNEDEIKAFFDNERLKPERNFYLRAAALWWHHHLKVSNPGKIITYDEIKDRSEIEFSEFAGLRVLPESGNLNKLTVHAHSASVFEPAFKHLKKTQQGYKLGTLDVLYSDEHYQTLSSKYPTSSI